MLGCAFAEGHEANSTETEWTWLGLVGIADPIRPGMQHVISKFHRAGIRTVLITGDQSATAQAVATELNLSGGDRMIKPGCSSIRLVPWSAEGRRYIQD